MPVDRSRLWISAALFALAAAAYAPMLDHEFLALDDDAYVTHNPELARGLEWPALVRAFSEFQRANWHPLTVLSYALDHRVHGLDPRGFLQTNLLLHAANAALLFLALARLTGALAPSTLAAALFAVHPIHVESVAWVSERKDLLSGLFFMLALLAHEGFARRGGALRYAALVAACALGLMAKSMLVTLPALLLLLDFWPLGRLQDPTSGRISLARLRAPLVEKLPLLALSAAAALLALLAQQGAGAAVDLASLPLGLRVSNALVSYVDYLRSAFWPSGLSVFYPYPESIAWWKPAAAAFGLAAVTALCLRAARRAPYLAVGWLWFLGMLLPVLGLVQVGAQARADRYMYLPFVGLALAAGFGTYAWAVSRRARALLTAGWLAALAALLVASELQLRVWRDSRSVLEHALAVTEGNYVAHYALGLALSRDGQLEEAATHLGQCLELKPYFAAARIALGDALLRAGRADQALETFTGGFALGYGGSAELRALRELAKAELAAGRGDFDAALERASEAVAIAEGASLSELAATARAQLAAYRERRALYSLGPG